MDKELTLWQETKTINVVVVFAVGGAVLGFILFDPAFSVVIGSAVFSAIVGFFLIRHLKKSEKAELDRIAKEARQAQMAAATKKVADVAQKTGDMVEKGAEKGVEVGGKIISGIGKLLKKVVKR